MDLYAMIKKLRNIYVLFASMVATLMIITVVRGGVLMITGGTTWLMQSVLTLVNIAVVPATFSMMSFRFIRRQIKPKSESGLQAYYRWSVVRLSLIVAPVVVDLVSAGLHLDDTNAALAIMLSLTLLFFYPSLRLYERDTK